MPECRTVRHPISPVPEWTELTMPGQVQYRTKLTQSGIFLVQYRTKILDAGMPMPALVSSMPMPSYAPNPSHPSPNNSLTHTQSFYIHTQQQANFVRAHESLDNKLGDIFCRRTLLFPSLTICFLCSYYIYLFLAHQHSWPKASMPAMDWKWGTSIRRVALLV